MTHRRQADAYDYLATSKVSELTVAQLEQSLENSYLNKSSMELWKGVITMHRLLEVSRTYPWGLPIPEQSKLATSGVIGGPEPFFDFAPTGTEVWSVVGLDGVAVAADVLTLVSLSDGVSTVDTHQPYTVTSTGNNIFHFENPFMITQGCFIRVTNQDPANNCTYNIAYHVVSM